MVNIHKFDRMPDKIGLTDFCCKSLSIWGNLTNGYGIDYNVFIEYSRFYFIQE